MDDEFDLNKAGTWATILLCVVILFIAAGGLSAVCGTTDPCDRCSHLSAEEGFDCFMACSEGNPPYPQEVQ